MVSEGLLGEIRLVQAEYVQDWLSEKLEETGQKQASWRTDPARSGAGGAIGDIGTHAYNLGCFVSCLEAQELAADLDAFVEGRLLDDNAHIMLRYKPSKPGARAAKGLLWASQVAPGNENALTLRVFGDKGGIEWAQENPNQLWFTPLGEAKRLITRGGAGANDAAAQVTRIPAGHPEGYLEAFATLYSEAAEAIRAARSGASPVPPALVPGVEDGLHGMRFVAACVKSSRSNAGWVTV